MMRGLQGSLCIACLLAAAWLIVAQDDSFTRPQDAEAMGMLLEWADSQGVTFAGWQQGVDPCGVPGSCCRLPCPIAWPPLSNSTTATPCSWSGICCESGHVTLLDLSCGQSVCAQPLRGALPTQALNLLDHLTALNMSGHQLDGGLQDMAWASLPLVALDLSWNQFQRGLPASRDFVQRPLQWLSLGHNAFTGVLPSTWGALQELQVVDLGTNRLGGVVPYSWTQLAQLQLLDVSSNCALCGGVPPLPGAVNVQGTNLGYACTPFLCKNRDWRPLIIGVAISGTCALLLTLLYCMRAHCGRSLLLAGLGQAGGDIARGAEATDVELGSVGPAGRGSMEGPRRRRRRPAVPLLRLTIDAGTGATLLQEVDSKRRKAHAEVDCDRTDWRSEQQQQDQQQQTPRRRRRHHRARPYAATVSAWAHTVTAPSPQHAAAQPALHGQPHEAGAQTHAAMQSSSPPHSAAAQHAQRAQHAQQPVAEAPSGADSSWVPGAAELSPGMQPAPARLCADPQGLGPQPHTPELQGTWPLVPHPAWQPMSQHDARTLAQPAQHSQQQQQQAASPPPLHLLTPSGALPSTSSGAHPSWPPAPHSLTPSSTQTALPPGTSIQTALPPGTSAQTALPLGTIAQHALPAGTSAQIALPPGSHPLTPSGSLPDPVPDPNPASPSGPPGGGWLPERGGALGRWVPVQGSLAPHAGHAEVSGAIEQQQEDGSSHAAAGSTASPASAWPAARPAPRHHHQQEEEGSNMCSRNAGEQPGWPGAGEPLVADGATPNVELTGQLPLCAWLPGVDVLVLFPDLEVLAFGVRDHHAAANDSNGGLEGSSCTYLATAKPSQPLCPPSCPTPSPACSTAPPPSPTPSPASSTTGGPSSSHTPC